MPSPPKPWEKNGAAVSSAIPSSIPAATSSVATDSPALPPKPTTMTGTSLPATNTSTLASTSTSAYQPGLSSFNSPYNSYGYGGGMGNSFGMGYGSPYSRLGSYGGFGGYGGYGGYGSYGGYGGYGGFGPRPGMMGPNGEMMNQPSLTQAMEQSTAATFQLIESIVGAFGGFAQMLESTFMATHSSFFAMIGVAEQFGHLRNYLGQVLSIFTLIRWAKDMIARATGRIPPSQLEQSKSLTAEGFKAFESKGGAAATATKAPKPSRKPILFFFLAIFGLPYLMNRLVKSLAARQEEEARRQGVRLGPDGRPIALDPSSAASASIIDPSTLTFVRATHDYSATDPIELSFKLNDIIAVLTPAGEREQPGWWRGRLRDGTQGYFPSTHVAELPGMNGAAPTKLIEPVGAEPVKVLS